MGASAFESAAYMFLSRDIQIFSRILNLSLDTTLPHLIASATKHYNSYSKSQLFGKFFIATLLSDTKKLGFFSLQSLTLTWSSLRLYSFGFISSSGSNIPNNAYFRFLLSFGSQGINFLRLLTLLISLVGLTAYYYDLFQNSPTASLLTASKTNILRPSKSNSPFKSSYSS